MGRLAIIGILWKELLMKYRFDAKALLGWSKIKTVIARQAYNRPRLLKFIPAILLVYQYSLDKKIFVQKKCLGKSFWPRKIYVKKNSGKKMIYVKK